MEAAAEAATEAAEAAKAAAEVEQAAKAATKVKGKPSQNAGASDRSAQRHSAEGVPSRTAMQRTTRLTATVVEQAAAEQRLLESVWISERAAVGQAAAGRAAEQAKEAEEPPTFGGFSLSDPMRASGASFGQRVFSSFVSAFGASRGETTTAASTAPEAPTAPAAPDDDGFVSQARTGPSQARGGHGTRRSRYGFRTLPTAHALAEGAPAAAEGRGQRMEVAPGGGPAVGCKNLLSQGRATAAIRCFEKVHRDFFDPYDASAALGDAVKQGSDGVAEGRLPRDTATVLTLRHDADMRNPNPIPDTDPDPDPGAD